MLSLTAAIQSNATSIDKILTELESSSFSERQGRLIDKDDAASMEKKKKLRLFLMSANSEKCSKDIIKVLTCGSVDDGKSTLLGRLMFETASIFSDQLEQLKDDSVKYGTQGKKLTLRYFLMG